jgi:hypothetical protein
VKTIHREVADWLVERLRQLEVEAAEMRVEIRQGNIDKAAGNWIDSDLYRGTRQQELKDLAAKINAGEALLAELLKGELK